MILGTKIFDCHHGKHRNYKRKQDANKKIEYDWVCFWNALRQKSDRHCKIENLSFYIIIFIIIIIIIIIIIVIIIIIIIIIIINIIYRRKESWLLHKKNS